MNRLQTMKFACLSLCDVIQLGLNQSLESLPTPFNLFFVEIWSMCIGFLLQYSKQDDIYSSVIKANCCKKIDCKMIGIVLITNTCMYLSQKNHRECMFKYMDEGSSSTDMRYSPFP